VLPVLPVLERLQLTLPPWCGHAFLGPTFLSMHEIRVVNGYGAALEEKEIHALFSLAWTRAQTDHVRPSIRSRDVSVDDLFFPHISRSCVISQMNRHRTDQLHTVDTDSLIPFFNKFMLQTVQ
jgi:hypothetical protein